MKINDMKDPIFWKICVLIAFILSYLLVRFIFFDLHGMKSWPNTLAVLGLIIVVIGILTNNQRLSLSTVIAYIGGFIIAMIFNKDGLDPGGGRTNNAWIIWGVFFLITIIVGILRDIVYERTRKSLKK